MALSARPLREIGREAAVLESHAMDGRSGLSGFEMTPVPSAFNRAAAVDDYTSSREKLGHGRPF